MPKHESETFEDRPPLRILLVDDEENMRHMLSSLLEAEGYEVETAGNGEEALEKTRDRFYDFVLCDVRMPKMDGMAFLKAAADGLQDTTVIMMSAYGSIDSALEAMKQGAYDYVSKPFKTDEVLLALKKAEEREVLRQENRRLKERLRHFEQDVTYGRMVGRSPGMQEVFRLARKAARFDSTVLITGESGTGKELVAQAIHHHGQRSSGPMIPVNCGGIPENLLESEMFGHVKGAFTGAEKNRKGLFAEADGGTIFLDEIGELPSQLQVKLLRVLQEGEIRPVGDSRTYTIDVRVIAATSKNLAAEMAAGAFREDLFYRLDVFRIHIPPLRERLEDIPLLLRHFIRVSNDRLGTRISGIVPGAMQVLMSYRWPGNVRELENAVERASVITEAGSLRLEDFPQTVIGDHRGESDGATDVHLQDYSIKKARRRVEKQLIAEALKATEGNRTQACRLLEISHPSLLSKIKAYGIEE
jgi:two-component system response regulator AtoC